MKLKCSEEIEDEKRRGSQTPSRNSRRASETPSGNSIEVQTPKRRNSDFTLTIGNSHSLKNSKGSCYQISRYHLFELVFSWHTFFEQTLATDTNEKFVE